MLLIFICLNYVVNSRLEQYAAPVGIFSVVGLTLELQLRLGVCAVNYDVNSVL